MIRSFRRVVCLWAVVMGACLMAGCEGGSSSTFQPATQTTTPTPVTTNPTDTTRRQGVSGVVVDGAASQRQNPLRPNTLVRVVRANSTFLTDAILIATARTDANGAFFIALEPGDYLVVADLPANRPEPSYRANPAEVRILPNEVVSDLRLGYGFLFN